MRKCLFLCTGNYYRSRFAEIYFNSLALRSGLSWQADSRGLRLEVANPGPISKATVAWLRNLGVEVPAVHRMPLPVLEVDLAAADLIVAVKEAEHRPLLQQHHPTWVDRVEFWHIHDQDVAMPHQALPELITRVDELLQRLTARPA